MNDGQALCANLVTAFMVFFASRFGLPVSTTHVSVGAITGVGIVNGTANGGSYHRNTNIVGSDAADGRTHLRHGLLAGYCWRLI